MANVNQVKRRKGRQMQKRFYLACVVVVVAGMVGSTHVQAADWGGEQHHLSGFLGGSKDGSKSGFTVGAEYEYRMSEMYGIGGLFEYAGGDFEETLLGVPLFIHPHMGWRFVVAPGLEFNGSTDFFIRTGVGYDFGIGEGWTLTPSFSVDWIDRDETLVYGLYIGRYF
jgi:hypothetical protein